MRIFASILLIVTIAQTQYQYHQHQYTYMSPQSVVGCWMEVSERNLGSGLYTKECTIYKIGIDAFPKWLCLPPQEIERQLFIETPLGEKEQRGVPRNLPGIFGYIHGYGDSRNADSNYLRLTATLEPLFPTSMKPSEVSFTLWVDMNDNVLPDTMTMRLRGRTIGLRRMPRCP